MKEKREIKRLVSEIRKILKKRKGIKEAWIFGSVVEKGVRKAEDIDIAIEGELDDFFPIYADLIFYLEKKLKKELTLCH